MKTKQSWTMLSVLLGLLVWVETASAFYNPSTGRWLNRDPLGEPGFELTANRLEKKAKPRVVAHFQEGMGERLMANPMTAMRVRERISRLENNFASKVDSSTGHQYLFVQNDPIDQIDVLGTDIHVWIWSCQMKCPCGEYGAVVGTTLSPVPEIEGIACCTKTREVYCPILASGDAMGTPLGRVISVAAALVAAEVRFQACLTTGGF